MSSSPVSWRGAVLIAAVVATGAWGAFLGVLNLQARGSFLDRIEAPLQDWRLLIAGRRPAPQGVVLVAIDDTTAQRAGAYPLPRPLLAQLLRKLQDAGATVVGFDMLFLDRAAGAADADLAAAMQGSRCVTGAAALFAVADAFVETSLGPGLSAPLPAADTILSPVSPLADSCSIGLVNVSADRAGTPRYMPMLIRSGSQILPSFALRAAALAAGTDPAIEQDAIMIGATRIRLDVGYHLPLRFYGPRGTVPTVSAQTILDGGGAAAVRGRIAIVGATAVGSADGFATAFDPVFPGLELIGTAVGHLVSGQILVRDRTTRRIDLVASVLVPVLTILALSARRIGAGIALAALPLAGWFAFAILAFDRNYWFAMAEPLAATVPPALMFGSLRLLREQRSKRRFRAQRETLRRFQSPVIADALAADPDFLLTPIELNAAVAFVDLSGFTGLSERLGGERTRALLKEFHTILEEQATRFGGLVGTFMGDGAMLLFGLPTPHVGDAARAIDAALALGAALSAWLARELEVDAEGPGFRIGAHYGAVVASRLGPDSHQHITATGDTVNVASRLMEVGKQANVGFVFSADLVDAAEAAHDDRLRDFIGPRDVGIRGRTQSLAVWLGQPTRAQTAVSGATP